MKKLLKLAPTLIGIFAALGLLTFLQTSFVEAAAQVGGLAVSYPTVKLLDPAVDPQLVKLHISSAPPQTFGKVQPGDIITYRLAYTNPAGVGPLTGVKITDVLPSNVTYIGPVGLPAPNLDQGKLLWTLGQVSSNMTGTVGFVAWVNDLATVPDGSTIVNTAQLGASNHQTISSNTDTIQVRYRFDLQLSMTDNKIRTRLNEILTYTINITNVTSMPIAATGIQVVDLIEPGLPNGTVGALKCASPCTGWTFRGPDVDGSLVYSRVIQSLMPNQSTVLTIVLQVSPTLPSSVNAVANAASALADDVHGVEVNPINQVDEDIDTIFTHQLFLPLVLKNR